MHSDQCSGLIQTLRAKYKIAFVDEFQDTDPVQWRIFKRLFLDHSIGSYENLLFLIGDPKQAIYSFRGADVYAYLEARNEMERLSGPVGPNCIPLQPTGVQSRNLLRRSMICLAGTNGSRGMSRPDLLRSVIKAPDRRMKPICRPFWLPIAPSGRCSMWLIFVERHHPGKPNPSWPGLLRGKSDIWLIVEVSKFRDQKRGDPVPLILAISAYLVRGKPDAFFLEPELTDLAIPYSFYKKPGLFLSDEALYLSLMFHAVFDPGSIPDVKKALLTPFFTCEPNDLFAYEALPVSHPLKKLLLDWHDLARNRKWGLLFQSLMEDSGLLSREAESRDWDRKYTNYHQIFEHLEAVAYRNNLDFRGLSALLDSYRKQTVGAEGDADIHQIETEAQKVQIMTMHVSKGLQFPVVFIAGGLTQPFADDYHVYHDYDPANPDAGIHKVIDLSRTYGREQHDREKNDEDKRLYYVALTRAQFKLYLPFFPANEQARLDGTGVSISLRLHYFGFLSEADANPSSGLAGCGCRHSSSARKMTGTWYRRSFLKTLSINTILFCRPITIINPEELCSNRSQAFNEDIITAPMQPPQETGFQVVREKDKEDDERFAGFDSDIIRSVRPDDEIPGGADIGSMFHDILEYIDFEAVAENPDDLLEERRPEMSSSKQWMPTG